MILLLIQVETEEEEKYDPCKRKIGEILWKEWYTPKMLNQERRSQGRRNWNALYQASLGTLSLVNIDPDGT